MEVKEVRNHLLDGIDRGFPPSEIEFIDIRLQEIADMEHMTMDELDNYCYADSNEIFECIYNYKEFNENNFRH